jgi:formamidopyrimidine-DNA glycosylase
MPELPEVETVRIGLAEHLLHRPIAAVAVSHNRAIRRHAAGDRKSVV